MRKDSPKNKVLKSLQKNYCFIIVSEKEHIKLKNASGGQIVLPNHKLLKGSTLSRELRNVGIDKDEFFKTY